MLKTALAFPFVICADLRLPWLRSRALVLTADFTLKLNVRPLDLVCVWQYTDLGSSITPSGCWCLVVR